MSLSRDASPVRTKKPVYLLLKGEKNEVYEAMSVHGVFTTLSEARERALEFLGNPADWTKNGANEWSNFYDCVEIVRRQKFTTAKEHREMCAKSNHHGHGTLNGMEFCYHCTPIIHCLECDHIKFWLKGRWWCQQCDRKE